MLLALAFAGLGSYLGGSETGAAGGYSLGGVYFSKLLDNEVSLADLRAAAAADEFRVSVGGRVEVESVPDSPYHVRISTIMADTEGLDSAHERAVHLLSLKLKEIALAEIDSTLAYLEKVQAKSGEMADLSSSARGPVPTRPLARLSESDTARAMLLKERVGQLEHFMAGGKLPPTVRTQLDRQSLRNAEQRVQGAKQELSRLARTFSADSSAVQAQRDLLKSFEGELLALERELAGIYLKACRLELETLNDKAAGLVESNRTLVAAEKEQPEALPGKSEGSQWLGDRAEELHSRAAVISEAATLELDGQLSSQTRSSSTRPYALFCWLAALASILAALFVSEKPSLREEEPERVVRPSVPVLKIQLSDSPAIGSGAARLDRMEAFLDEVSEKVRSGLGRAPKRLLILGDHLQETRLSFSIRLANQLGQTYSRVRLIDFDLKDKGLSHRLGRERLPGVADLLNGGGPVEEFFSSVAGTKIQFAPAGCAGLSTHHSLAAKLDLLLGEERGITVIDAGTEAPMEVLAHAVDAVLFVTPGSGGDASAPLPVLSVLRNAGLPVWGVCLEDTRVYPLL